MARELSSEVEESHTHTHAHTHTHTHCTTGECDVRGAYCAASVATMTGLKGNGLFDGTPQWVSQCQTYDGGISAVPGTEAHGGYAFCGLAALMLLDSAESLDVAKLARWAVSFFLSFFSPCYSLHIVTTLCGDGECMG